MFRNLAMSLVLVAGFATSSLAQCNCSECNQQGSFFDRACSSEWKPDFSGSDRACEGDPCEAFVGGHYFSAFGGFVDIDNYERTLDNGPNTNLDGAKLHDDFAWGAAVGRQVHPHGRAEFEFTFRENDVSSWFEQEFDNTGAMTSNNVLAATGTLTSYSGMFNFLFDLYDRQIGRPGMYLGGGIGAIYVDADFATAANAYESVDTSFAYQLIGGFNLPMSDRVDLFTEFRYLGADYLTVDNLTTSQSMGDFTIDTHNIFFGARFRR